MAPREGRELTVALDEDRGRDFEAVRGPPPAGARWPCWVVVFLFWSTQWAELDIAGAFFRSLISCDPPVPRDGVCATGTVYRNGTCEPVPRGEDAWSGSANCYSKDTTVIQSNALGGRIAAMSGLWTMLAGTSFGIVLIDTWGRKPMMVLALCGQLLCCLLFVAICLWRHTADPFTSGLLYLGSSFAAGLNAFAPASGAMAADSADPRLEQSSAGSQAAVNIAKTAGVLTSFGAGYFVLLADLTDYAGVWTTFSILIFVYIAAALLLLRETNPRKVDPVPGLARLHEAGEASTSSTQTPWRTSAGGVGGSFVAAYRLVRQDRSLRWLLLWDAIGNYSVYGSITLSGPWAMLMCGYNQAVSSLGGVLQPACIVAGSALLAPTTRKLGLYPAVLIGLALQLVGCVVVGLGAFTPRLITRVLYWLGWGLLVGLGFGMAGPGFAAAACARVGDFDNGKIFSALQLLQALAAATATYSFTNVFLGGGSVGDDAETAKQLVRCWFACTAIVLLVFPCWLRAYAASAMPVASARA